MIEYEAEQKVKQIIYISKTQAIVEVRPSLSFSIRARIPLTPDLLFGFKRVRTPDKTTIMPTRKAISHRFGTICSLYWRGEK